MLDFFTRCQRLRNDQRWLRSNIDIIIGPRNNKNQIKIKTVRQYLLGPLYRVFIEMAPQLCLLLRKDRRNDNNSYTQKLYFVITEDSQDTKFETDTSSMGVRRLTYR
jgi:hypothetical protein